jgi:outer membrane protein assembly factor BamD
MEWKSFLKWMILLPLGLFILFGCVGKDIKTIEGDPEVLYRQGLALFNKRNYPDALKKFEELKSSFPDSPPYTVWAEMKVGDCHFFNKDYVEATAAYEEFKKIHPAHEEIQYVQYQIGMSYFSQMLTLDRDQTYATKALASFEYLVANYPPSLFTEKANEKIKTCRKRLADHEFYIGDFYYNKGRFQAAASRFEGLLGKFPKMPEEDKTLFLLGKSYLETDQVEKAKEAFSRVVIEYPKSSYTKEAKAFLDRGLKKKVSPPKGKGEDSAKKAEPTEVELSKVALVKYDEEGRQPVRLVPSASSSLPKAEPIIEVKPEEEKRVTLIPEQPAPVQKEKGEPQKEELKKEEAKKEIPKKEALLEPGRIPPVDTTQPIDITSDRVEAYAKDNLIIFKGNVMARQKDIVIYADSIEASMIEGAKGIEKVVAGGNVKMQLGRRVANCQKAVFYNLDQKVVLTGEPKLSEGDNIVSGDEIVYDIERNRVEVKGGTGGRGKVRIQPGEEFGKKN